MLGRIYAAIAALGVTTLAVISALFVGRKQGRDRAKIEDQASYIDKRKELDNADIGIGASDDDRIKRLREISGK